MSERWGFDEPEGEIIGEFFVRYEFWQKHPVFEWQERLGWEYFESDEAALEWLQEKFPEAYAARHTRPIEMRVYDQPGKREQAAQG